MNVLNKYYFLSCEKIYNEKIERIFNGHSIAMQLQ